MAEVVASALHACGLGPGDVIAVQVPNWVEGAVAYAAAMLLGAVIVPIVHIYGPAEVGFILRQSTRAVLVVPDRWRRIDYTARLAELGDIPELETIVVIGDGCPAGRGGVDRSRTRPGGTAAVDDVVVGRRGVPDLHVGHDGRAQGRAAQPRHDARGGPVTRWPWCRTGRRGATLGSFPAGHIAGVLSFLRTFVLGTDSVLLDMWDAPLAARLVAEHGIESTAGTPYFVTSFFEAADADGRDVSSLTKFMVGAANVPRWWSNWPRPVASPRTAPTARPSTPP